MKLTRVLLGALLLYQNCVYGMEGDGESQNPPAFCVVALPGSVGSSGVSVAVGTSDEESDQPLCCLLCGEPCNRMVGLVHEFADARHLFVFHLRCLEQKIRQNPKLWKCFKCTCGRMLKEKCLEHIKVIDVIDYSKFYPDIPVCCVAEFPEASIMKWLRQQRMSDLTLNLQRYQHYDDRLTIGILVIVVSAIIMMLSGLIPLSVDCLPCRDACCKEHDECKTMSKDDCALSCPSCKWVLGIELAPMCFVIVTLFGCLGSSHRLNYKKSNAEQELHELKQHNEE